MMSRCILRSYADGDNGYRAEIKEGKASERQKVAARAAWLGRMLGLAGLSGGSCVPVGTEEGDENSVAPSLLACLAWGCARSFRHSRVFLCSFSPPFTWAFCSQTFI